MKKSLIALALLAASPFAASAADGLSYNYAEAGYMASRLDGPDTKGWGLRGSVAVAPNFHAFAGYNNQRIDGTKADVNNFRIGGGYNTAISANTDFVGRLAYERYGSNVSGAGSFNGYSAEAGVRTAFTPNFEGTAAIGYEDGKDFDGDVYGRLGATAKFTPNWGINGDVKIAKGATQWFVGPRFTW